MDRAKKSIAINYINKLSAIESIKLPSNLFDNSSHSWNQFAIRIMDNSFGKFKTYFRGCS